MSKKTTDATNDDLPKGKTLGINEIGTADSIDPVSEADFVSEVEKNKFMNDPIRILVHESQVDGELDIICVTVNQLNQPIRRGEETIVKRKYVEALARAKTTRWAQQMDPLERERIKMVEKTTLSYPFSVLEDPHPNGRHWLKAILAER